MRYYMVDTTKGVVIIKSPKSVTAKSKVLRKGLKPTSAQRILWAEKYEFPSDIPSNLLKAHGIKPRCHRCDKLVKEKFKIKHGRAYCDGCIGDVK